MTEQVDLDALEALAKAANSGPWHSRNSIEVHAPSLRELPSGEEQDDTICQSLEANDAGYIAAANPATVLALIAELRQERERADAEHYAKNRAKNAHLDTKDALSRAEETIEKIGQILVGCAISPSVRADAVFTILAEYDKQKEADRG